MVRTVLDQLRASLTGRPSCQFKVVVLGRQRPFADLQLIALTIVRSLLGGFLLSGWFFYGVRHRARTGPATT